MGIAAAPLASRDVLGIGTGERGLSRNRSLSRSSLLSLKSLRTSLLQTIDEGATLAAPTTSEAAASPPVQEPPVPQLEPTKTVTRTRGRSCSESRASMLEPIAVADPEGNVMLALPTLSTPHPAQAKVERVANDKPRSKPSEPFFDADVVLPSPETESDGEKKWYEQSLEAAYCPSGQAFMRLGTLLANENHGNEGLWTRCHLDAVERARGIALIHTVSFHLPRSVGRRLDGLLVD